MNGSKDYYILLSGNTTLETQNHRYTYGDGYTDKDLMEFKRDIPANYYIRPIPQGQIDAMEMDDSEKANYQNPAYRN